MLLLVPLAAVFGWLCLLALAQQRWLNILLSGVALALVAFFAYAGLTTSVVADESTVRRPRPWPRSCNRSDLAAIRFGNKLGTPTWRFVRTDGRVAFKVSPNMFPRATMQSLADYLRVPLEAGEGPST